jgi:WD40 repeat protein/predicted transcriptional regulator
MGLMGKTSLSLQLIDHIKEHFDIIIWRTLKNRYSLTHLLTDCLKVISQQENIELINDSYQGISQLLDYCTESRCLIIIDNFESILEPEKHCGNYQDQYQDYGQLLERFVNNNRDMKSCLLLTSRESPNELTLYRENRYSNSFNIPPLKTAQVKKIFHDIGTFEGSEEDWNKLTNYYQGNPKALQWVAVNLRDLETTNLSDHVSQLDDRSRDLYSDITELLEEQFKRLSKTEKKDSQEIETKVLYGLAIAREPITIKELNESILNISESKIANAISSLLGRCLIEKSQGKFTLQNVTLDYITQKFINNITKELKQGKFNLFNEYNLVQATAKEYIRDIQTRMILSPIIDKLDFNAMEAYYFQTDQENRENPFNISYHQWQELTTLSGYAGTNLISLLSHGKDGDLRGGNFSNLTFNKAYFQGLNLQYTNFSNAVFNDCIFSQTLGSIISLAFHPQPHIMATGDNHGMIYLWDIEQKKKLLQIEAHQTWCWSLAFSNDGEMLATGGKNGTIKLWFIHDSEYELITEFTGHTLAVRSLAFNKNNTILASGSEDCTVKLWDIPNRKYHKTLSGHQRPIGGVSFSPTNNMLASASADGTIKLWNLDDEKSCRNLTLHEDWVWSVAFSPDGELLASGGGDGVLMIWDTQTGKPLQQFNGHGSFIWSVAFSNDGDTIATGSEDKTVRLWSVKQERCLDTLTGYNNSIWSVGFSSDGQTVAGGCVDRSVKLYSVKEGRCLHTLQGYSNGIFALRFTEVNEIIGKVADNSVQVWSINQENSLKTYQDNLRWLVTGNLALDNNNHILASTGDDETIELWDLNEQKFLYSLKDHQKKVWSVAFHPYDSILASGSGDNTIKLWSMEENRYQQPFLGHSAWVLSLAFSPNGKYLASGSEDTTVRLWNMKKRDCIHIFREHQGRIWTVAFSRDSRYLASGSDDKTISIWEIKTGKCIKVLEGHQDWIWCLDFSPNGQYLATGSDDRTVKLWDIHRETCLETFHHQGGVRAIAFSPDGNYIASGSEDETIKLWNLKEKDSYQTYRAIRLYEGMNITEVKGLTPATQSMLGLLGATTI